MSVLLSNTLFLYSGSEFCVAHAQSKFVKVVLYHKMISSSTLTSVGSFMLVSGKAQSWLLATWLLVSVMNVKKYIFVLWSLEFEIQ